MDTTYEHLLATLARAETELVEAERIACELVRNRYLTAECRQMVNCALGCVGNAELLIRDRARR